MNNLFIAKMVISIDKNWSINHTFNSSVKEGVFKYDSLTNSFIGKDFSISKDISCKSSSSSIELVQAFSSKLSDTELHKVEENMKLKLFSILEDYRNFLSEKNISCNKKIKIS